MGLEKLRADGADHEHGNAGRPLREMLNEGQHRRVRPVHILEHEKQRLPDATSSKNRCPCRKHLVAFTSLATESD
jgi:hypothetical protein